MTVANAAMQEADSVVVLVGSDDQQGPHSAAITSHRLELPQWVSKYEESSGEALQVDEWKEEHAASSTSDHSYRQKHGWLGRDLIHDIHSPVRVMNYYVHYGTEQPLTGLSRGGVGTRLTGIVHFTKRAESHPGFCHGGSMTSVLDDVIGWVAFLVTGQCRPWSGFTVQVNTSLKRPIPVDSILVVQATIVQVIRRKVSVEATIFDPQENEELENDGDVFSIQPNAIHATAEGLVVMNRGVMPADYDRSSTMSTASSSMSDTY